MLIKGLNMVEDNCTSREPQSMFISGDCFVTKVDLDATDPYCMVQHKDSIDVDNEVKVRIPRALAYYLRTHFCGSLAMHDKLIEHGHQEIRSTIRTALGI